MIRAATAVPPTPSLASPLLAGYKFLPSGTASGHAQQHQAMSPLASFPFSQGCLPDFCLTGLASRGVQRQALMPAVSAGKQQTKPPQDPEIFQAPGPSFLISLYHEGISVTAQLRALGKQEGGFRLSSISTRHHIHGLASTHICCITTTVSHLWFVEETGKQKELETFTLLRCRCLCRSYKRFPSKQEPALESKVASPVGLPTNIPKRPEVQQQQSGQ